MRTLLESNKRKIPIRKSRASLVNSTLYLDTNQQKIISNIRYYIWFKISAKLIMYTIYLSWVNKSITWSGAFLDGTGRFSLRSSRSSLYPNLRKTVHVVSRRPFSINSAWRKRNPVRVSPKSLTPSGTFSWTTLLTPTISAGCRGALKHLTCHENRKDL